MVMGERLKEYKILCDGGLGNRLCALTIGHIIAKELNRIPVVYWPKTLWCDCLFSDLFDSEIKAIEQDFIVPYVPYESIKSRKQFEDIADLISQFHIAPPCITNEEVSEVLKSFKIKDFILEKVNNFCTEYFINKNINGIHIRRTDVRKGLSIDIVKETIQNNPNKIFFICTDSEEVYKELSYPNIIFNKKQFYPTKVKSNLPWQCKLIKQDNKTSNVYRSKESIIDSFIDMLILSKTTIILDDKSEWYSTFLEFAKRYQ